MASFDENGKYIKMNWKAGDKITATKLNKIEESIEAVNDNDISRHVEADARLDALEAKDVAHDKEFTNVKNTIANNKAAAELGDYEINSRMTFLENELNEGIEEVHNVAETVDGKIAKAEANMTSAVAQGKADMEAMVAEVEADLEGLHAKDEELSEQLARIENKNEVNVKDFGAIGGAENDINDTEAFLQCFEYANNSHKNIIIPEGEYYINDALVSNGTYTIKGHNAKIICNVDMLDSFLIINKSIADLNEMTNIYDSGIDCLYLEGNGKCDHTLYIEQGKAITLNKLVCRGGKRYSCLIGSDKGQTWELNVRQCEFNANIPEGNQGEYAFYMLKNISDSFISDSYFINGSDGWARFCAASTNINNIHGYSYPKDLAPEIGFHVYASSTYFGYVICDTPGKIGMLIEGNGCVINNLNVSGYAHIVDEYIGCYVKANNTNIITLSPGSDFEGDATKVTGVLLDTESNTSIMDFKLLSFYNHFRINHDIRVTGKIPFRFTYDKNSLSANPIKLGNYVLHNNYIYSCAAGTTKTINFKNEFPDSLYNVGLYEITGKSIPKHAIINGTTGFDIKFLEDVTETLNIRAIVTTV